MKHDKPYDKTVFRSLAMITQFSLNMLVPIGMMTALGIFLDQRFHTYWITVALFFLGAVAGGQNVYRMAKKIFSDTGDTRETGETGGKADQRPSRETEGKE